MATAEAQAPRPSRIVGRWSAQPIHAALALVLCVALALRLWGIRNGLPFAFNADEADHFVPKAVAMFQSGSLNPHYFANPPAFTYLLHFAFDLWFGGGGAVQRAFARHPQQVYTLARVIAALLGTASVWLLYATGARLLGRAAGLLAAALLAVAFLPVFYAHLALNDVPTLAPLTLSLLGSAGVLRKGRRRDYAVAGVGLGLACATKYTAGIVLLVLLAAAAARLREDRRADVAIGLVLAGALSLACFVLANPYAILDYSSFHHELVHQSQLSGEAQGKLGAPHHGGLLYYLWSLTWGLGWAPALAALGGAVVVWRREAPLGWMLVPATIAFLAFMGLQGRYFGRWLLPAFPIVCLLAAVLAAAAAPVVAAGLRRGRLRPGAATAVACGALSAGLLAQGLVYSVHSGIVLARADTRNIALAWMKAHIPEGAPIVVEPMAPDDWVAQSPGAPGCGTRRWCKYPSEFSRIDSAGAIVGGRLRFVGIENYERTLSPALLGWYTEHGFCWVVSGSTQSGRALADPRAVPNAIAYYAALARDGEVAFEASPFSGRAGVAFNFDWSFDYYPLAYRRSGPRVTIYRLRGGRCG